MSVKILIGDVREQLPLLPAGSVHCCVTSPPYFGLRDYGHAGQIGLEATPDAFAAEMVAVFREVKRVLRDDGTLWLNLGDSYAGSGKGGNPDPGSSKQATNAGSQSVGCLYGTNVTRKTFYGIKAKDLIGIPWRVAFALQADGWYLRQDIIWSKPNPMPESVTDRCTKAHEYIFLLSKSARYYYDAEAIKEDAIYSGLKNQDDSGFKDPRSFNGKHKNGYNSDGEPKSFKGSKFNSGKTAEHQLGRASNKPREPRGKARNKRSVWSVATSPYSEAHFATFPPALIEPCIKAGCPIGGTVLDPFGGAGTTALVADRLQRDSILIELNPEYAAMAERRVYGDSPLFAKPALPNTVAEMEGR